MRAARQFRPFDARYCVLGTLKALQLNVPPVGAAAMGVITAAVGGILRDMVAMRPSILLMRELYVTAAAVGASLTVILGRGRSRQDPGRHCCGAGGVPEAGGRHPVRLEAALESEVEP